MSVSGIESLSKFIDPQKMQEILGGITGNIFTFLLHVRVKNIVVRKFVRNYIYSPSLFNNVADILNKNSSNAVLVGITVVWFLFEVVQILLAPVLCYILILFMFIMFAWSKAAGVIKLSPPSTSDIKLSESVVEQINWCLQTFYEISCGEDLKLFFMTMASLFVMSFLGNYVSFFTLTYIAVLSVRVLPPLYEQNKEQVELVVARTNLDIKKLLDELRSKFLDKIPRAAN
ncbi:reticulon-like protein B14 [Tripterygium wilfordii]|uniref:reticulon-like protein B14 n=1 Tax=Tripterygium wilfordii TaxID=458696 RepID=UPI0018F845A8|nr:reticulon-like protein B14 [Tripterygium wilfordii]